MLRFKILMIGLILMTQLAAQDISVIFRVQLDSNENISRLVEVSDGLLFEKNKIIPHRGVICGTGGPVYETLTDIYKIANDSASLFIGYNPDNSPITDREDMDSTFILSQYTYFDYLDIGLFLPNYPLNHYWIYFDKKVKRIKLRDQELISSYYPFQFMNNLMVYVRDSTISSQLSYIDSVSLQPNRIFNNTSMLRMHNPVVYDSMLIFNGYNPTTKDHNLFYSNGDMTITKITNFPRGLYHFNQESRVDSLVYLRFQNKGIADNYTNTKFGPTSFWKFNLENKKLSHIRDMDNYGITSSSMTIQNSFFTLYGYYKYKAFQISEDRVLRNISNMVNDLDYLRPFGTEFNDNYLTIGVDVYNKNRIVLFNEKGGHTISPPVDSISRVRVLNNQVFFLTNDNNGQIQLLIFDNDGELFHVEEFDEIIQDFQILSTSEETYLLIETEPYSKLYKFNVDDMNMSLVLDRITSNGDRHMKNNGVNYLYANNTYYFITNTDSIERESLIYKLE